MARPSTLGRDISPPPSRKRSIAQEADRSSAPVLSQRKPIHENRILHTDGPSLAAIESGKREIRDHLLYFANRLSAVSRPSEGPRLSFVDWEKLYQRNQQEHGCHFVVHQHDHPVSGVHYDLRLQFSRTSSISFAIPYGLPGNPNSIRPNRMAIETRVHNLWNNLIESASHSTGSLLIWDTGEYEILAGDEPEDPMTDDESCHERVHNEFDHCPQNERLYQAFQSHHIRLRLHGVRLPDGYTISLRLPRANDRSRQPPKSRIKRRRTDPAVKLTRTSSTVSTDSDSSPDSASGGADDRTPQSTDPRTSSSAVAAASEDEADDDNDEEDATIRANNAYTGATNSIGSVHQRHWFLTLDRRRSGFHKVRKSAPDQGRWVGRWPGFIVRGREYERSVLTGRSAEEVMADEGVEKYVGRKMWRAIVE